MWTEASDGVVVAKFGSYAEANAPWTSDKGFPVQDETIMGVDLR